MSPGELVLLPHTVHSMLLCLLSFSMTTWEQTRMQ